MFGKHLKFFRNLLRNKVYAFFSIISLTIGLSCSILIYLYVSNELSYDTFFKHADRIVRLEYVTAFQSGGPWYHYAILPRPDSKLLAQLNATPEIVKHTRIATLYTLFVRSKRTNKIMESNGFAADSNFFHVFNFKILQGNSQSPLSQPNSVVLTQKTAHKFFGNENPIGKTFFAYYVHRKVTLKVTAVMENVPRDSHFNFNFLIDSASLKKLYGFTITSSYGAWEYLLLSGNTNIETVTGKIDQAIPTNETKDLHYALMPLTKIHLYSHARYEIKPNGNIHTVYFFSFIAIIILIISSINFISLFLSYSTSRYKEIGVRKVLGANNHQITVQLLFESISMAALSLPVAFILNWLCLSGFGSLTGRIFTIHDLLSFKLISIALIFAVFTGLLSGTYPALILPVRAGRKLVNNFLTKSTKNSIFQNTIVIFQFAASSILIIGMLIIWHQLSYVQNKKMGFDKKGIITTTDYPANKLGVFKHLLSGNPNIEDISASSYIPGVSETGGTGLVRSIGNGKKITCEWVSVDYDYFKTYGIKIIKGRAFSKAFPTDSTNAFMLNQAAVKALGLRNPVGKQLKFYPEKTGEIIGIVKNFNYLSLHKKIPPMIFMINPKVYFSLSFKLATNKNIQNTLGDIKKAWYAVVPNAPFQYSFLNQKMNDLYKSDQNTGKGFFVFSVIAILVSCLGLFSLASYSLQKKTKEIGIRKVLGATVSNILGLFYSKYFKLIIISNVIAIPVAYFLLQNWLANFAYRIHIGILPFLASFVITITFTVIAVSYWTFKAAYSNPVDSIRRE